MIKIDNIERLKKINDLSKELLKHGIVANSEEACAQARSMIDKEDSYKDVIGQEIQLKPTPDYDIRQKIKEVLDQSLRANNEILLNHISALKNQMLEMAAELGRLKNEVSRIQTRPVQEIQSSLPKQEPRQEKQEKKEEAHARVGNFKPGDEAVAIDKVFYFGR